MDETFIKATNQLDEDEFQLLYGRWDPLEPRQVADLLAPSPVRWWIAGGRAARVGAPPRRHEDTDVVIRADDVDELRKALSDWHVWENRGGALRPLLDVATLAPDCEQLWVRRNAGEPWQLDVLLNPGDDEWVFKGDARVHLPWSRALHTVDGITYQRPEVALLHKAHLDRPKDREDLAAAHLDPAGRAWLVETLELLGNHEWARLAGAQQDRP
jgi:hypothetical protein